MVRLGYGADARGRTGAGLVTSVEEGAAFSQQIHYDEAFNVDKVETSARDRRPQPTTTAGTGRCGASPGCPRTADYPEVGGRHATRARGRRSSGPSTPRGTWCASGGCRTSRRPGGRARPGAAGWRAATATTPASSWSRSRRRNCASATAPARSIRRRRWCGPTSYDELGRLQTSARALTRPDLVTTYTYDQAGRMATVHTGDEGRAGSATTSCRGWCSPPTATTACGAAATTPGAGSSRRSGPPGPSCAGASTRPTTRSRRRRSTPTRRQPDAHVLGDIRTYFTSFGAPQQVVQTLDRAGGRRRGGGAGDRPRVRRLGAGHGGVERSVEHRGSRSASTARPAAARWSSSTSPRAGGCSASSASAAARPRRRSTACATPTAPESEAPWPETDDPAGGGAGPERTWSRPSRRPPTGATPSAVRWRSGGATGRS